MNHLYYTWCRAEHSLSGNSGWGIRALSPDFPEYEANQLIPHVSNFQFLDTISPENSPVRLAYVKHPELGDILIHAVAIGQCPGQSRGGNYFVHCLTHLDENFDGFQAIRHWDSPSWVKEDFDSPAGPPSWNAPNIDFDSTGGICKKLLDPEYYDTAMYCLEAFLALELDETKKLYIAGPSEDIAQLIGVVGISLSRERRKGMTFSTYDNLNSPPDVKIMGCFFTDENTEDFPPYHYQDGFYSVNTCFNKRSVAAPPESKFARGILPILRDYGGKHVQIIHDFIERIGRDEPRDHEIIFALYPQQEIPIQLDPNSIHYVMLHWPIDFLDRLPDPRREEFLKLIRKDCHPNKDTNSRNWMLKNLVYLKALSQKSPYMQALLKDLFENNGLEASLVYLNYYPSYIDGNVPVDSRSRAIYGIGQAYSKPIPSVDDLQALQVLSSHWLILANEINDIPPDNGNSVPVRLWLNLTWNCGGPEEMEKLFGLFGNLTNGKQGFLEWILKSYSFFKNRFEEKVFTFLEYADANKLTIPPDTLGNIFEKNDEFFFLVFNKLDKNPTYLKQLFSDHSAPFFFEAYSGQNKSMRYKTIVDEKQIEPANFDRIRHCANNKEVDQYLLYTNLPPNKIFLSLYQEEVGGFSLDDLLEKNKYDLCWRLESEGYVSKKTHQIIANLDVYALVQNENNWARVRDDQTMFSLINIYHSNRGKPRTEQFLRLYTEYIYTGINDFTALEKYLYRLPTDPTDQDQRDANRDTKLDVLEQLMKLIETKPAKDPQRKKTIAAIWFYVAILLPDGNTAESKSMNPIKPPPLIDYRWIFWLKGEAKIPEGVGKAIKSKFEEVKKKLLAQPPVLKAFVGGPLLNFFNNYQSVLDKKFKHQMLLAFSQKAITDENQICFTGSLARRPLWKEWWFLVLLILFVVMVGFILSLVVLKLIG